MASETGHQPSRAYFDQSGNIHLNGASLFDGSENDLTGGFALASATSLNAAGTVIANATALSGGLNVVAGANDAAGVILPTAAARSLVAVYSSQATNGLLIYPPVNGTINGGSANSSINIEGKSLALFIGTNTTNWAAIYTVNS